ncbi:MAG: TlpA family protein disulfide reductase, partial [Planctomycetia bacterium]|nr:TlpA family protein disulfide reductase [Planctomycetia bacterium]
MPHARPSPPTRSPSLGPFRLVLAASVVLAGAAGRAEGPPEGLVLHLRDGGSVPGEIVDSAKPGVLGWQAPAFVGPFEFAISAVSSVSSPARSDLPRPSGDYRVQLAAGDIVFGSLVGLDGTGAVLDVPTLGRLNVPRDGLRRIDRWRAGADSIYLGPGGLSGWHEPPGGAPGGWQEEAGALFTAEYGAAIWSDLGIPGRAAIEFELSWKSRPAFVLALGVNADKATALRAFRFEVWDGELVVSREADREADVASLGKVTSDVNTGAGRVHFRAYLDQERGRLSVVSAKGERLADLKVGGPANGVFPGVRLENQRGDVRLDRIRVTRWAGEVPTAPEGGGDVQLSDGTTVPGRLARYDPASREFVVAEGVETRIPEDRVSRVTLSTRDDEPRGAVRVVLRGGARLSGDLVKVDEGRLWLNVPGVKDVLKLPSADVRSLVVPSRLDPEPGGPKSKGRLELEGVRLNGRLEDGVRRPGASGLNWRPDGSLTASPLRPGVSGRIVYKEPRQYSSLSPADSARFEVPFPGPVAIQPGMAPPPAQLRVRIVPQAPARRPPQAVGAVQGFLSGFAGGEAAQSAPGRRTLYLRSGDVIPSDVTKIDEDGVSFRSSMTDKTFVPHDEVKAVELAPEPPASVTLNKSKRERLLTLPRVQRGSPPTHLVRSRNGDYLRGRVVGLDETTLRVEVRLETRDVPRERVSRIIWLHPDELEPPQPVVPTPGGDGDTRVQVVRGDGVRLTFDAERFQGTTLSGASALLGACRVRLDDADRLLIGPAIEAEVARLAYRQWKLRYAPEPKPPPDGPGSGTESAMVGKPAPDFELALLGGKSFRLSDTKGRVVVLDFWASWCGPCLQTMPQVEKVTDEFRDRGV